MARANIITKDGVKIAIQGSPREVADLISQIKGTLSFHGHKSGKRFPDVEKSRERQRSTPINLISSLIDGGFFKKPMDLGAVKVALEEQGYHYPVTTLSPALLRLVRKRQLRRIKDKKKWVYVG